MKMEESFGLKIAWLDNPNELTAAQHERCDVAQLTGENPDFGLVRPLKITWRYYFTGDRQNLPLVRSAKLGKNLTKWVQEMATHNLHFDIHKDLSEDAFNDWFLVFSEIFSGKKKVNMHVTDNWLEEKREKGKKTFGIFLYRDNELLGGDIGFYAEGMLSVGYGAVKEVPGLKWNLGALIDYEVIKYAQELKLNKVNFGKDNNFYGWYLSAGLFSYKTRLGLTPEADLKSGFVTTKILSFEHLTDPVIFLRKNDGEYITTIFSERTDIPLKEYQTRGISKIEILPRN